MILLCFVVVKATVLLADMNDFNSVNDVYKQCKYALLPQRLDASVKLMCV